ncbi:hypothetical protein FQB35_01425 [Crassaminicella thermophila]|uniref:TusA-related sulfurtransferase n=1 Tax=Crassaminicella thermophila TaxID=2599308 RepID=A0A5C0SC92_CRATE|nr:hypothetical protein [Crassaminicella thermophila]QEK11128.1 hypothetical protein FQB35_01425 [Crassaminicella thermophila]
MIDHYINYDKELGMNANTKLIDLLKDVGDDEELIITMEGNDAAQSDYLFDILKKNGFEVLPKGGHDDNKYHIIAHRKRV